MTRRILARVTSLLAVVLVAAPAAAPAQDMSNRLTLDHYMDWESVSSPHLSPDGSKIIYEREWIDKFSDRQVGQIWMMNADGSKNRFLLDGSSPRWSPDGTRIAYVASGEPQGRQIFVRWMDAEGATSQITRLEESPGNIRWSPDGTRIAFTMSVDAPPRPEWRLDMPDKPEGAEWTAAPVIEERLSWRRDRSGWSSRDYSHIFVVSADGGTPRQVTSGEYDHGGGEWMPDGRTIVFSGLREDDAEHQYRESAIYAVDVPSGQVRTLTTRRGTESGPVVSPDGNWIAYQGNPFTRDTYRENELYVMRADGSDQRKIAEELGRGLSDVQWDADSRGVYFNAAIRGTENLWYASRDGDVRQITEGNHMLGTSHVQGGTAVGTRSSYYEPGSLVKYSLSNPSQIQVLKTTNQAVLDQVELGEVEEIWYESEDDVMIQGWITKPPDFDPSEKYPLILRIHGGPHSMYHSGFDYRNQNHAAHGYVVLHTNPQGSSGYGSEFGNAINYNYPGPDYPDLMAGVDTMLNRGYIDERNLFVFGGSGGGVLTTWIVGHTDRFTAAVANAPVTNWMSFVGTTDGSSWYYDFETLPWLDPSEHLQRSSLMYVENVTTPTMLMVGENDLRTPREQTEQYYRALKLRQIPTAMVILSDGWHSRSWPPTNFIRTQLLLRNWFERYMVGDGTMAAEESGGS